MKSHKLIDIDVLRRVAKDERSYAAGQTIFKTGDLATELFIIKEGSVAVRIGDRTLETLGPDEMFGEMAIVERQARGATVVAETDCVVIPVGEKQFLILIRQEPNFAVGIMRVMAQRLKASNSAAET
jgi:CRP/FNR family cyclic AMP-dependent transcriptional regulator